jgi:DNA-binding response OmpR family regulator
LAEGGVYVSLDTNEICVGGFRPVLLYPQEAELAYLLAQASPRLLPAGFLADGLWGSGDPPANVDKHIQVVICRLRRKILPLGLLIEVRTSRGYRMIFKDMGFAFRKIGRGPAESLAAEQLALT